MREEELQIGDTRKHECGASTTGATDSAGPVANAVVMGLPPRIAIPVIAVVGVLFLCVMGYLLYAGLGTTGSAFGPGVHNGGDTNLQATPAPVTAR